MPDGKSEKEFDIGPDATLFLESRLLCVQPLAHGAIRRVQTSRSTSRSCCNHYDTVPVDVCVETEDDHNIE